MEIQGHPNYLIYEDGRVYNKKYDRFLKPSITCNGYLRYHLCHNGKMTNMFSHRLVGLHYIPNPNNHPQVDHIDRNTQNNNVNNLRWVNLKTQNENRDYTNIGKHLISNKEDKYIYRRKGRNNKLSNTFTLDIKKYNLHKSFKSLQEAIDYRDKFLLEQQQEQ